MSLERISPDEFQKLDEKDLKEEGVSKTSNIIGDPLDVLLDETTRKNITDTLLLKRRKNGKDVIFEVKIKTLEAPEFDKINDDCTEVTRNRRSGTTTKEVNQKQFRRMVAYQGLISPDLSDEKIKKQFNVIRGKEWASLDDIFFAGEVDYIATEVMKLSGYTDDFVETVSK